MLMNEFMRKRQSRLQVEAKKMPKVSQDEAYKQYDRLYKISDQPNENDPNRAEKCSNCQI